MIDFDVYVEKINNKYLTDEAIKDTLKEVYKKGYEQARIDILLNTKGILMNALKKKVKN